MLKPPLFSQEKEGRRLRLNYRRDLDLMDNGSVAKRMEKN